jgi:hypothetical protein
LIVNSDEENGEDGYLNEGTKDYFYHYLYDINRHNLSFLITQQRLYLIIIIMIIVM